MDDAVETFTTLTQAPANVAERYLGMTDGNVEQAIQLYFDSPDLASGIADSQPDPPIPTLTHPSHASGILQDSVHALHPSTTDDDNMDYISDDDAAATAAAVGRAADFEDDEAVARRLQEEMYTGGGPTGGFGEDGVRAPIARTTETLVGGPGGHFDDDDEEDIHARVLEQMRARRQPRQQGVFNQRPVPSIWGDDSAVQRQVSSRATGGPPDTSNKSARLAELFRPPFELMQQIPWDNAREKGKETEKWLLVNIQEPSIFDCQQLNRDIWKHPGIQELIKEHFIFMQFNKDDPRGSQYCQYYFPLRDSDAAYPHIAIVDTRTGEQLKIWSGPPIPNATDFLIQLVEFLDRYSFDQTKKNPVAKRKVEKAKAIDVDRLTEEEMLELALQNSLTTATGPVGPKETDPDEMTKSFVDEGKGKSNQVEEDTTQSNSLQFSKISSSNSHVEPTAQGPNVTRIQFKHSDGRIVRKFLVSDSVRRIYEWLKAEPIGGKDGVAFELKDGGKDLLESLDLTIGEAGLKQSTVMVEFIEDS